jgi:hypothetical protein
MWSVSEKPVIEKISECGKSSCPNLFSMKRGLASNLDIPEWADAFPNRILGEATIDRLLHGAYDVLLDGRSIRAPRTSTTGREAAPRALQRAEGRSSDYRYSFKYNFIPSLIEIDNGSMPHH